MGRAARSRFWGRSVVSASRHTRELGIANNSRLGRTDSQRIKTRADVLGDAMARAETRAAGGAMPQECRMRNAMIAMMAAAATAGTAVASMTVLDPFTLPQASGTEQLNQDYPDAPYYAYTGSYEALAGSPFGWRSVNTIITATAATQGGLAPAGTASLESTSEGAASFSLYNAKAFFVYSAGSTPGTASVNMSSLLANDAAFQVQISELGAGSNGILTVTLEDANGNLAFYEPFGINSNGLATIDLDFAEAGFDQTAVKFMLFYVESNVAFSGTLSNFTIPAPGALALLGVAGLVGARRRR